MFFVILSEVLDLPQDIQLARAFRDSVTDLGDAASHGETILTNTRVYVCVCAIVTGRLYLLTHVCICVCVCHCYRSRLYLHTRVYVCVCAIVTEVAEYVWSSGMFSGKNILKRNIRQSPLNFNPIFSCLKVRQM